jgi:hypothetical protein
MSPRITPQEKHNQEVLGRAKGALTVARIEQRWRTPYGPRSEHSWVRDSAAATINDVEAKDRLEAYGRWRRDQPKEARAISTTTVGGLIPSTIEPWVAEAVAYGLRSTAPLALALERLDLPPVGMNAAWAKVTTATTVPAAQSAQNSALTQSADTAIGSTTDPLQTIGSFVDFSSQSQEMSGGWFDNVIGEELGRAFGTRLETQLWSGTGSGGQIQGFQTMTGSSSSTVAGQSLAQVTAKIQDQYQQVFTNLGSAPDLLAMHPRRYANLMQGTNALGLAFDDAVADSLTIVASPAASVNLGATTNEDWILVLNRAAVPLVRDPEPNIEFHNQGPSAGTNLTFRWLIYAYLTLGVSRRPEGVGLVKGATTPSF